MTKKMKKDANALDAKRLQLALEAAKGAVFYYDLINDIIEWDAANFELLGFDKESIANTRKDWEKRIHPDDLSKVIKAMDEVFADKEKDSFNVEYRIILPDNTIRNFNARAWIDRDEHGKPLAFAGVHFDITEQKLAELQLKTSEERYRVLYEGINDAVLLVDEDGYFDFNTAACEMFGYTAEEMRKLHMRDLSPDTHKETPEYIALQRENYIKTLEQGPQQFEWVHQKKNGELFQVSVVSRMIEINGKMIMQGVVRDISNHKKLERELLQRQDELQRAQEIAKFGHWIYDVKTETFTGSKEALRHYQLKNENANLYEIAEKIEPSFRKMVYRQFKECMNSGTRFNHDFQIILEDESKMWINSVAYPELDEQGQVVKILGTTMDITKRKQNELAIEQHSQFERIINRLSSNLVDLKNLDEKIENILATIGEFVNVDRAYVYLVSKDGTTIENSHVWYSSRSKLKDKITAIIDPAKSLPWFWSLIKNGKTVHIPSIKDFPEEAKSEKQFWLDKEFKAFLALPMINNKRLIGFLGFADEKYEKTWDENAIALLRITAETFSRALEQKRMYDSLRRSEERFRRLIKDSPVAMVVSDNSMFVIDVNSQFEKLTGYTRRELSHEKIWWDLLVPNPQYRFHIKQWWDKLVNDALDNKNSITEPIEVVFTCKDGEKRDILINVAFTGDFKLIVLQDHTKQRQGEALLLAQRDLAIALGQSVGLDETLKICTEAAINNSFMDSGGVYLVIPASKSIQLHFSMGLSKDFCNAVSYFDASSPNVKAIMRGKPIYDHYSKYTGPDDEIAKNEQLKAFANIPITYHDNVIGCMNVASHLLDTVPEYSRLILETIAGQMGQAIMRVRALDTLREREENLKMFFESVNDFLFVLDERASILQINRAVTQHLGYTELDIIGESILTLHPPELKNIASEIILDVLSQNRFLYDLPLMNKSGDEIPVETKITAGQWNGRTAFFCVSRDVTERKRAEQALMRTSSFLKTVIDEAPFGIEICEGDKHDWEFTIINKEAQRILGTTAEQHRGIGKRNGNFLKAESFTWQFLHLDGSVCNSSQFPLFITLEKGRTVTNQELIIKQSDNSQMIVIINASPIFDDEGGIIGGLVSYTDISERKKAERELLDSRERLAKAEEIGHLGSWEIDLVTGESKWSDEFLRICGFEPGKGEMTKELSAEITHPEDRYLVDEEMKRVLLEKDKYNVEKRIIRPDGEIRYTHSVGRVVLDDAGKPVKIIGSFLDITDRVLSEQETLRLERQIQEVQKHESLGVLAGGIAHNFNNALLAVLGNLELARYNIDSGDKAFKNIVNAESAADRAAELSRLMLVYVGQGQEHYVKLPMSDLLVETCQRFKSEVPENIKIHCSYPNDNDFRVHGSKMLLKESLQHLITNAIESIKDGNGEISITIEEKMLKDKTLQMSKVLEKPKEGKFVCLTVKDTGSGMSKETFERMFEPYFTTKFIGRGLGLAAVLGIVRGHRGAIFVKSEEGEGTEVMVALPSIE